MNTRAGLLRLSGFAFIGLSALPHLAVAQASAPASSPAASMGDYALNAGLYMFVVGIALMFAIGVLAGMKR